MDLPFFDNIDFESIAKARKNELAFEEFRVAMDKAIRDIPSEDNPEVFQRRLDELSHDRLYLPLLRIRTYASTILMWGDLSC